jgi:hypothetical protein
MNRGLRAVLAGAAALAVLASAGCSKAVTDSQQQAIRYTGGAVNSAENFKTCQSGPKQEYGSWGDNVYYYPAGQRTFAFTDDEKAFPETGPLGVATKDKQEMKVRGLITFHLTTNCDILKRFHENIGKTKEADFVKGSFSDDGWSELLSLYFTAPINSIADTIGLGYTWTEMYSNSEIQTKFEDGIKDKLGAAINAKLGEDVITIDAVDVQRPEPSDKLKALMQQTEETKTEQANEKQRLLGLQDNETQAKELAKRKADTAQQCLTAYTKEQCMILELAKDGKIPFYPIPSGGSVNVTPPK